MLQSNRPFFASLPFFSFLCFFSCHNLMRDEQAQSELHGQAGI